MNARPADRDHRALWRGARPADEGDDAGWPRIHDHRPDGRAPRHDAHGDGPARGRAVCIILSCYPKVPECLGCASKGVFLCCEIEAVLCKTGRQEGSICMCMKTEVEVIKPTVCIKCTEQLLCLDLRCALPFDDEVPCVCAALGLTMMKDFKCLCSCGDKLGDKGEDKPEGAPPAAEQGEGGIECEKMTR